MDKTKQLELWGIALIIYQFLTFYGLMNSLIELKKQSTDQLDNGNDLHLYEYRDWKLADGVCCASLLF